MAAEGDGLALLVAAVRVAAIAGREIHQRQMARIDFDAAELDRLRLENRHDPQELRLMALAQFVKPRRRGSRWLRPVLRRLLAQILGPLRTGKSHPPGAADRGVAR